MLGTRSKRFNNSYRIGFPTRRAGKSSSIGRDTIAPWPPAGALFGADLPALALRPAPAAMSAATGDGRHDGYFVAVLQFRGLGLKETDVLLVQVDVHKAAQLAAVVAEAFLESGVLGFQSGDQGVDTAGLHLHLGGVGREV